MFDIKVWTFEVKLRLFWRQNLRILSGINVPKGNIISTHEDLSDSTMTINV